MRSVVLTPEDIDTVKKREVEVRARINKFLAECEEKAKAPSPPESNPIKEARELLLLQEKKAQMESDLYKLDEEIRRKRADPQVAKAVKLLNRF